jgi:hypothetical protein
MMQEMDSLKMERRRNEVSVAEDDKNLAKLAHQEGELGFRIIRSVELLLNEFLPRRSV